MNRFFGKFKIGRAAPVIFGLFFMFLLFVRLGFFRNETPPPTNLRRLPEKKTWMSILHQDQKIGYAHRRLIPKEAGYLLSEKAFLRINTMGLVQDIQILTTGNLKPDLSLASFTFELKSNLFNFKTHGRISGNELTVFIDDKPIKIAIKDRLYLAAGILDAVWLENMEPNQTRSFPVFDPSTMGTRQVHVTLMGTEDLIVMGQKQRTKKISVDFMGSTQTAWVDRGGSVVKEKGFMGLTLKRVSETDARKDLVASRDLTRTASVAVNELIDRADRLKQLRLRISGIEFERVFLNAGRQTLKNDILTISKESLPYQSNISTEKTAEHSDPTPFIQSDHPKIKKTAETIISPNDPDSVRAEKIVNWVHRHIEKRPVLSVPNALETLENRMGDCNEHAVLLAALARASGIPAQVEAGLVYMKGRFYYHAWNVLFLGDWITADALMGQIPADVTHIRFVRGEPSEQIDLMGVIGKVKIDIMEQIR